MSRRERPAKLLVMALAWVAIFGAGFVLFTFRDDLGWVAQRLRAEATGHAGRRKAQKSASRWRSTAISGSKGTINDVPIKFLVDSGATMTTIGRADADARRGRRQSAAATSSCAPAMASSACRARAPRRLSIGGIERTDVGLHVAENEDLNVLGMNFLSSLDRWGVEGRWLILRP